MGVIGFSAATVEFAGFGLITRGDFVMVRLGLDVLLLAFDVPPLSIGRLSKKSPLGIGVDCRLFCMLPRGCFVYVFVLMLISLLWMLMSFRYGRFFVKARSDDTSPSDDTKLMASLSLPLMNIG